MSGNKKHSFKGKKVVFTGKMESGDRDEMESQAETLGADVDKTVSGNTDYLICGRQVAHNATNAKFKKAKKLGVTILNEDEYRKLIG